MTSPSLSFIIPLLAGLTAATITALTGHFILNGNRRRLAAFLQGPSGGPPTHEHNPAGLVRGLLIRRRTLRRQALVAAEIPFLIDLLALGIDGGMNIYKAMEAAADLVSEPLKGELRDLMKGLGLARPMGEALEDLASGWPVEEVKTLARILRIGHALGTPVSDSLRQAATFTRRWQHLRQERHLATVPMKITISTLIFFLPPVFVLILVPNLLNFMSGKW